MSDQKSLSLRSQFSIPADELQPFFSPGPFDYDNQSDNKYSSLQQQNFSLTENHPLYPLERP